MRFGAFNIFFPLLLKPARPISRDAVVAEECRRQRVDRLPRSAACRSDLVATDPATPEAFYRAYGYHVCGPRAVRLDMLERLADLIRPLLAWRGPGKSVLTPPRGATGDGGFTATAR